MLSNTTAPKASARSRRQALLTGAAIALAMTALARSPQARAQAFQGTPTVTNGSVTINRAGTQDTFTVDTAQAVINWAPSDTATGGAPINFLPSGSTATYQNSANVTGFTVLNRIIPTDQTRAVQFNGTVQSRIDGVAGGSVWFYSPGGIVAGAGAVFDVGSLVLTANEIDTNGGLFGPGGEIRFTGVTNPLAAVDIQSGAQITAAPGSYIALVAPRVVQSGTVEGFQSAAYVGAEQVELTINEGLFDINIITGTTDATGVRHTGTTSSAAAANSGIFLATVAKNDAVSMLVRGTLGYTPASSASVDNGGVVVLSAGYSIEGGAIDPVDQAISGAASNITIEAGTFTSNVVAQSQGLLTVSPAAGLTLDFARDATLTSAGSISFGADSRETINVGRNLTLRAGREGVGGSAALFSEFEAGYGSAPGQVNVGGDLIVDASATGLDGLAAEAMFGGNAIGGTASISITGGGLSVGGATSVLADAQGGLGLSGSGAGVGGLASVVVTGASNVSLGANGAGALTISASVKRPEDEGQILLGGDAISDTARAELRVTSGATLTAGAVVVRADAEGGHGGFVSGAESAGGAGGSAEAGVASISVSGGTLNVASADVSANASGGRGEFLSPSGGAVGGTATISATGGDIAATGALTVSAVGSTGYGATVGEAYGGQAIVRSSFGAAISAGSLNLDADADGQFGADAGGSAFGGMIILGAEGGSVAVDFLSLSADGFAGGGDLEGGAAMGGTINVSSLPNGGIIVGDSSFITANGVGGEGDQGGDGHGGIIDLTARGGAIDLGFGDIYAEGRAGRSFSGEPTSGSGGAITITTQAGGASNALIRFDDLFVGVGGEGSGGFASFARATGPNGETPSAGSGGIGIGGEITVTLNAGQMIGTNLRLNSNGQGGAARSDGPGGDGEGGKVDFLLTGGTATIDDVEITADGFGGEGYFGGDEVGATAGGAGFGGEVNLIASTGTLTIGDLLVQANGDGGDGGFGFDSNAAAGGNGYGGDAVVRLQGATVDIGLIEVDAVGTGGDGGLVGYFDFGGEGGFDFDFDDQAGDGGVGYGGDALVELLSGTVSAGTLRADAGGFGGEGGYADANVNGDADPNGTTTGGDGGAGFGGSAGIRIAIDNPDVSSIQVAANGFGGEGGSGFDDFTNIGGSGGDGTGGGASLLAVDATMNLFNVNVGANGEGGRGGSGETSDGGDGGAAFGGTARVEASGPDAELTITNLTLLALADGGFAGHAGEDSNLPDQGGRGGRGGDATGGTAEVVAELGTIILDTSSDSNVEGGSAFIRASAFAGDGGNGGDGANPGASGGTGGDGGNADGGTIRFSSVGGSIETGDINLSSQGLGGEGGFGGFGPFDPGNPEVDPPIPPSGPVRALGGAGGLGSGGTIEIETGDINEVGALGTIHLERTTLNASGIETGYGGTSTEAGRIDINDFGAAADSIRFTSVEAFASGGAATEGSGFFLTSEAGSVRVDESITVDTDAAIDIQAIGTGGLVAGSSVSLFSGGTVRFAHDEQPATAVNTVDATFIDVVATGNIDALPGAVLSADSSVSLRSNTGSISAARLLSGDRIDITAFGNATIGDAISDGTNSEGNSRINILAGFTSVSEGSFVPADAIVTGTVSADEVSVRAGQDIVVQSGGTITADEVLELYAFRDIRGLGNLITPGVLNIGVGRDLGMGTIDVGDAINTIDQFGNVILANRLSVSGDLTIAQLIRVDTGDLDLNAGSDFDIARAESNGSLFVNAGASGVIDEAAADGSVDINAGDDTNVGAITAGGDVFVNAGAATSVTSITSGDDVFLNAGTGLTLGTANAGGFVNANAGTDVTIGTIVSDDSIDLSASGDISADSLTSAFEIDIFGGGDVTIGEATTLGGDGETGYGFQGSDIDVFANGAIDIGTATSAGAIFLDATNVVADSLIADFEIDIFADGDVTIGSALTTGDGEEFGYGNGGEGGFFYNDIDISANGNVNVGSADSDGNIGIEAFGTVTAGSLTARGNTDGDPDLEGNIGIGAEGSIDIGTANAARDLGLASLGGDVSGDSLTAASDVLVLADGDINLGDVTAGGLVYLGGPGLLDVITGGEGGGFDDFADFNELDGDLLIGSDPIEAGGRIDATGLISAGDLIAGAQDGISLTSTDVDNDAVLQSSGGAVIVTTDLGVGGVVRAFGTGIDFTSLGALTIDEATATDGDIDVIATQRLTVDDLDSAGDIRLTSTAESVFLADVTTQRPVFQGEEGQRSAALRPLGEGSGNPGPGDIIIEAAIDIVADGEVDARRNLSMDAGRTIEINDDAYGVAIDLKSADIDIDDEIGQLGRSTTTTSIRFENSNAGARTFIGGTDADVAGYQLRANELNRVFSNGDIAIVAPGGTSEASTQPNVVIGTMTIRGQSSSGGATAGQIANGGRFSVETPGLLAITGDVDFVGINNDARVALNAGQQISLAAETGSVSLRGAGNALAGELQLTSATIIAGTADAIADVAAATSTDAIDDRLGQSEGTASDDGFFAARGMRVQASSGFFVQNSGASAGTAPDDRRGITVGEGGLRVQTSGASTRIVVNGRQANADGSFATGTDFLGRVQISGNSEGSSVLFDPRSTINGCLISGGAQCGAVVEPPPPPPPPMFDPTPVTRDIIDLVEEIRPGGDPGEGTAFPTALVTFADFESFGFEPLIDEPVTGAGNDDFWIEPEDDEDEEE